MGRVSISIRDRPPGIGAIVQDNFHDVVRWRGFGVAPANLRRPKLGIEAITLPLSTNPGRLRPKLSNSVSKIRTPLTATNNT